MYWDLGLDIAENGIIFAERKDLGLDIPESGIIFAERKVTDRK